MAHKESHAGPTPSHAHALAQTLRDDGYCIVRRAVPTVTVATVWDDLAERFERTPFSDGDFYGRRTKRFGGVLKRSVRSAELVTHPLILDVANLILGPYCDRLQLNLTQALAIHPGEIAQAAHRDEDMWSGPKGDVEYLLNIMWPFSPYRADNGATQIYPASHLDRTRAYGDEEAISAEMDPGDVLLFLGSTLHGGGSNRSLKPRTGLVVSYCLGWLKPYENQWLVYPPEIARTFPSDVADLAGYKQHRPNLGNYEGQCPSVLLRGAPSEFLGAVDDLRPEQAEALARRSAFLRQG